MDKAKEDLWTRSFVLDTLINFLVFLIYYCLLYTSDAADDLLCVDLGGRRILKKKKTKKKKKNLF